MAYSPTKAAAVTTTAIAGVFSVTANANNVGGPDPENIDCGTGWQNLTYANSPAGIHYNDETGIHSGGYIEGDTIVNCERITGAAGASNSFTANPAATKGYDFVGSPAHPNQFILGPQNDKARGGSDSDTYTVTFGNNTIIDPGGAADKVRLVGAHWDLETMNIVGNKLHASGTSNWRAVDFGYGDGIGGIEEWDVNGTVYASTQALQEAIYAAQNPAGPICDSVQNGAFVPDPDLDQAFDEAICDGQVITTVDYSGMTDAVIYNHCNGSNVVIVGENKQDVIYGGIDTIIGSNASGVRNTFTDNCGSSGSPMTYIGGAGDDIFNICGPAIMEAKGGYNTLNLSSCLGPVTADMAMGQITDDSGDIGLVMLDAPNILGLRLTGWNDVVYPGAANIHVFGGAGDDEMHYTSGVHGYYPKFSGEGGEDVLMVDTWGVYDCILQPQGSPITQTRMYCDGSSSFAVVYPSTEDIYFSSGGMLLTLYDDGMYHSPDARDVQFAARALGPNNNPSPFSEPANAYVDAGETKTLQWDQGHCDENGDLAEIASFQIDYGVVPYYTGSVTVQITDPDLDQYPLSPDAACQDNVSYIKEITPEI